jgi:hypothetical protein
MRRGAQVTPACNTRFHDTKTPGRLIVATGRLRLPYLERDTGFEPATFSLGS